jgi:predicted nucleic acid-binding protein
MAPRVYADTSVFGGAFDEEFQGPSETFFDQVRAGRFQLVTSAVVQQEIEAAPAKVRRLFEVLLESAELVEVSEEALRLQSAYTEAGVVTRQWEVDALHVALATVGRCSLIVSWNFAHIVHFNKIPRYNAVNVLKGYRQIGIYSPWEVVGDEGQSV